MKRITTPIESWINEFDDQFGKAYISDGDGGHFIGSYLIEFITKLLSHQRTTLEREYNERLAVEVAAQASNYEQKITVLKAEAKGQRTTVLREVRERVDRVKYLLENIQLTKINNESFLRVKIEEATNLQNAINILDTVKPKEEV